jgi:hypothetical protein
MTKRFNEQVCLKLAAPLRNSLEEEAAARGRSLSNLIRHALVEHSARWMVARAAQVSERAGAGTDAGATR